MRRNIKMINQSRNANAEREHTEVYQLGFFCFFVFFAAIEIIVSHSSIKKKNKNELDSSKV